MFEARIAKVVMVGCAALFALLVAADNLTDYGTNYAFVSHVLSMDTTFPGNALLYRRITSPILWQAGYALIIAGEGLTGAAFAIATISSGPSASLGPHPLQSREAICLCRRHAWVSGVVLRLYGGRRRVVFDVGIAEMEWAGGGVSLLHYNPRRPDLC